jgi:hypothetical protein
MKSKLEKQHYLWVPSLITKSRATDLAKQFVDASKDFGTDTQCPGAPAYYDFMPFVALMCEKTPVVSKLIGEPVIPTYTYARVYGKGAVLKAHRDRPSCEISLTLNLSSDKVWPIYMEIPGGKKAADIRLTPGSAALYLGCETTHWRDPFEGNRCVQVFMHYVRLHGEYAKDHYFDFQWKRSDEYGK